MARIQMYLVLLGSADGCLLYFPVRYQGLWQVLPGASWTCPWVKTCPLCRGCPEKWHSWNDCMIFTNIPYLITLTVFHWPSSAVKPWSDTLVVLAGQPKNFCCSSVVFERKWSPGAFSPMNPAAEREESVTMAKEPTRLPSLKLHDYWHHAGKGPSYQHALSPALAMQTSSYLIIYCDCICRVWLYSIWGPFQPSRCFCIVQEVPGLVVLLPGLMKWW